jgi:Spy/CpxP family protein refolding chaperone
MFKPLTPLIGAALFAVSTALFAQQTTPAPAPKADKGGQEKHGRFDCSKAKDPKACEERREKMKAAHNKARQACDAKQGDERRDCMRKEMCAQAKDPAQCEARFKEGMERRKKALEACKDKQGDELKACVREQRSKK